jgi:hypothetical protein
MREGQFGFGSRLRGSNGVMLHKPTSRELRPDLLDLAALERSRLRRRTLRVGMLKTPFLLNGTAVAFPVMIAKRLFANLVFIRVRNSF